VGNESFSNYPFSLGIASGDPRPNWVVLWTRLAPEPPAEDGRGGMPEETVPVHWEVADDENFSQIVTQETANARPGLGHSVHAVARGLEPNRNYFYRFKAGSEISPVGRTKTVPARGATVSEMRFAFASCQQTLGHRASSQRTRT
jgi:alkaline phosphatase D